MRHFAQKVTRQESRGERESPGDKIQPMFNFFKKKPKPDEAPAADSVDMDAAIEIMKFEGSDFVIRSRTIFAIDKTMDVTVSIPQPNGTLKKRRAELKLIGSKVLDEGGFEYEGILEDVSPEMEEFLRRRFEEQTLERRRKSGADQRGGDRASLTFAVISRAFKNFKAVSADISPTGTKVFVDEPVDVGKVIDITMNFDDDNFESIRCHAEVMWCRPAERNHAVGLRFTDMTPEQLETVLGYIKHVEEYTARVLRRPPA